MLRIRLSRFGRRHRPFYRIIVIESYKKREGKYIESLGWYDPLVQDKSKRLKFNQERYDYWVSKGAKPSDAVLKLILPVEEKKKLWPDKVKEVKEDEQPKEAKTEAKPEANSEEDSEEKSSEAKTEEKVEAKPAEKTDTSSEEKPTKKTEEEQEEVVEEKPVEKEEKQASDSKTDSKEEESAK